MSVDDDDDDCFWCYWSVMCIYIIFKTSETSLAPDGCRALHTGRGSDAIVLIEPGPRLQASSRIQADRQGRLVTYEYCLLVKQVAMTSFLQK